jgi:serine/threonine protein kinase
MIVVKSCDLAIKSEKMISSQIRKEIDVLKELDHPHIIKFIRSFDYSKQLSLICILMEYAGRGNLRDFIVS